MASMTDWWVTHKVGGGTKESTSELRASEVRRVFVTFLANFGALFPPFCPSNFIVCDYTWLL